MFKSVGATLQMLPETFLRQLELATLDANEHLKVIEMGSVTLLTDDSGAVVLRGPSQHLVLLWRHELVRHGTHVVVMHRVHPITGRVTVVILHHRVSVMVVVMLNVTTDISGV